MSITTKTITKKDSTYFADLFRNFDGETSSEKLENWNLGYKAENNPGSLTAKEAFTVSFIIERIQNHAAKCKESNHVVKLEELRLNILESLS